jgi:lipid-binding SYLF domain-containing protein
LYRTTPAAQKQAESAAAILVFPEVVKAGLVIGGTYGTGALLADGKTIGYLTSKFRFRHGPGAAIGIRSTPGGSQRR